MSDKEPQDTIVDPKERKKLIEDISKMKDILDSYKYGLNFEQFAESLFRTIDRQTIAIKQLNDMMQKINDRMEKLENQLDEGITLRVKGLSSESIDGQDEFIIDKPVEVEKPEATESSDEAGLRSEMKELETKIARLFEKENELTEMALNDPASAEEYEEKAYVAKDMRTNLEKRLKEVKETLNE